MRLTLELYVQTELTEPVGTLGRQLRQGHRWKGREKAVMCMGTMEPDGCTPAKVTVISRTSFPDGRVTTQREVLRVKA